MRMERGRTWGRRTVIDQNGDDAQRGKTGRLTFVEINFLQFFDPFAQRLAHRRRHRSFAVQTLGGVFRQEFTDRAAGVHLLAFQFDQMIF